MQFLYFTCSLSESCNYNDNNNNNNNNNNNETLEHLISSCSFLVQHEHVPTAVLDTRDFKLLWDFKIVTDVTIHHNRPDLTLVRKS